jgi:Concanavalin A-like lectin/glucanases superfamily
MKKYIATLLFIFLFAFEAFGSWTFVGAGSTRIEVGTFDYLSSTSSICALIYPTTVNTTYTPLFEHTKSDFSFYGGIALNNTAAGDIVTFRARATVDQEALSNGAVVTVNTWQWVCGTFDSAGSGHIYHTNLGGTLSEIGSYASTTAGSGAFKSADGVSQAMIGNNYAAGSGFPGKIAVVMTHAAVLNAGQLQSWISRPRSLDANTTAVWILGANGTTNIPDYSGNNRTGSVGGTGGTLSDNAGIGSIFGL